MGWDAFSSAVNHWNGDCKIKDKTLRKAFKEAVDRCMEQGADSVDCMLASGGLDVSTCGKMLEKATGYSCYNPNGWSIELVRTLHNTVDWDFEYDPKDKWAYLSAKEFLRVCAENFLSISFSW